MSIGIDFWRRRWVTFRDMTFDDISQNFEEYVADGTIQDHLATLNATEHWELLMKDTKRYKHLFKNPIVRTGDDWVTFDGIIMAAVNCDIDSVKEWSYVGGFVDVIAS